MLWNSHLSAEEDIMPYSNVIDMPLQEENDDLFGMGRYREQSI